jgi:hypothetical protein
MLSLYNINDYETLIWANNPTDAIFIYHELFKFSPFFKMRKIDDTEIIYLLKYPECVNNDVIEITERVWMIESEDELPVRELMNVEVMTTIGKIAREYEALGI